MKTDLRRCVGGNGLAWLLAAGLALAALGCEDESTNVKLTHEKELSTLHRVAVVPLIDAPKSPDSGQIVVNAIIAEIYQCPGLTVVERSRLKAIMDERSLQTSQLQDTSVATEIGKIAGADAVILGEVTQYEAQEEYSHGAVYVVSAGETKHKHRVGISLRMVDVKTGEVLYAELGGGESKEGYSDAAKAAAEEAVKPLQKFYERQSAPKKP
jgi:TolB-like protein